MLKDINYTFIEMNLTKGNISMQYLALFGKRKTISISKITFHLFTLLMYTICT